MPRPSIFLAALLFIFFSCKKEKEEPVFSSLRLELNTPFIYSDGFDELHIKVMDGENRDITANALILVDGSAISGNIFTTHTAGTRQVKATVSGKETSTLSFTALRHETNNFSRKIVLEEFAGAWCGYCPDLTRLVDSFQSVNSNIIPIQFHNGDIYEYPYENQVRNRYGISSFPSVYLNRSYYWDKTAGALENELNKKSKCGIALQNTVRGDNLMITARIKFDVTSSIPMNLVVALVEDSLISSQNNLFNNAPGSYFYNLGNPILNYRHNNVLRSAATDIFGDSIPVSEQRKNNVYTKSFTVNTRGYNTNNCKIVAFVLFRDNTVSLFGILNAQAVIAGQSVGFD